MSSTIVLYTTVYTILAITRNTWFHLCIKLQLSNGRQAVFLVWDSSGFYDKFLSRLYILFQLVLCNSKGCSSHRKQTKWNVGHLTYSVEKPHSPLKSWNSAEFQQSLKKEVLQVELHCYYLCNSQMVVSVNAIIHKFSTVQPIRNFSLKNNFVKYKV